MNNNIPKNTFYANSCETCCIAFRATSSRSTLSLSTLLSCLGTVLESTPQISPHQTLHTAFWNECCVVAPVARARMNGCPQIPINQEYLLMVVYWKIKKSRDVIVTGCRSCIKDGRACWFPIRRLQPVDCEE